MKSFNISFHFWKYHTQWISFMIIFVINKVFKTLFTIWNLLRYYCLSVSTFISAWYLVLWNVLFLTSVSLKFKIALLIFYATQSLIIFFTNHQGWFIKPFFSKLQQFFYSFSFYLFSNIFLYWFLPYSLFYPFLY